MGKVGGAMAQDWPEWRTVCVSVSIYSREIGSSGYYTIEFFEGHGVESPER